MQFLYFIIITIIASIIYMPIEKKYKFNKRYKVKENRSFRFIIVLIGVIGIIGELCIGFSNLENDSLLRITLENLFLVPLLFTVNVGNPLTDSDE